MLEPCVGPACGDLAEVDEHDRVSLVQLAHRAVDGVVVQQGPAEEPPGARRLHEPLPGALDADGVAHAVLSIASGQEHPEATSLVVTGEGIDAI